MDAELRELIDKKSEDRQFNELFPRPFWYGFSAVAPLATLVIVVSGRIERIA